MQAPTKARNPTMARFPFMIPRCSVGARTTAIGWRLRAGKTCAIVGNKMLPNNDFWLRRCGLNSLWLVSWPMLFTLLTGGPAQGNPVITATFDSTITGDPNAAAIESTINSVIALYEANFSDPITVMINFQEMAGGLGQNSSYFIPGVPYSTFRAMLAAAATTANDNNALANLPAGGANPV